MITDPVDRLLGLVQRAKRHTPAGKPPYWTARCPAHDDTRNSLSIGHGENGAVLVKCHAGCTVESIVDGLGLTMRDLFNDSPSMNGPPKGQGRGDVIAEYDYCAEDGSALFQSVRLEPKGFFQRRPNGKGGWTNGLGDTRRVLYRLPEVLKAIAAEHTVYVVEGEKDADRLAAAGLCATTNPMGAGKWRPEYSESLRNAIVCIVPDHDDVGHQHAQDVAVSLHGIAREVRILELPDLGPRTSKHGQDVSDWLDSGHTVEELAELAYNAPSTNDTRRPLLDDNPHSQAGLGEWDAGDDADPIPPRGWLLANSFCRDFVSSLLADGGVGKTALRVAQLVSLATGRALTDEHVFQRCRVLLVSLEDDRDELRRRIRAVCLHHNIERRELKDWLWLASIGADAGKLMIERDGAIVRSTLAASIEATIIRRSIDIVSLDPFVKSHGVDENSNRAIDAVVQLLADMATRHHIAVDVPHHTSKGISEPGNANRGRGATAMKDGARLVYTLTPMSTDEAQTFGIEDAERRFLVRMDSGKVNIAPPLTHAKWFRLVGVRLENATALYPNGDEVQTVAPWEPPDTWGSLSVGLLNLILDHIEAGLADGNRYSAAGSATDRAAWRVVVEHAPHKTEGQAREIIRSWIKGGVLVCRDYEQPDTFKTRKGLYVEPSKRPR